MSHSLLTHLADRYTFDGSPSFADLGAYHVPFDELTNTARVEARIAAGAVRGERMALIAQTGSGKSSVISHVLGPAVTGVAPIVVPVRPLEEGATSSARIADELLSLLGRYAGQVDELEDSVRVAGSTRQITHSHRHSSGVGLALSWLRGDLARDVTRQTQTDQHITLREKTEVLGQALDRIRLADLQPIVVFDDTDRWLADTDVVTVSSFFRDIIRWLTELPVSVVVAAHTHYFDRGVPRTDLLEFLDTPVHVPRVPDASALATILTRRISLNVEGTDQSGAKLDGALTDAAVDALFAAYAEGASLRRVLQISHVALAEAINADADLIGGDHVTAAHRAE